MERIPSHRRRRPHVVCLGAATFDTIFRMDALPTRPGKVLPNDVVQVAHGMASSAAAAIVRLGGMEHSVRPGRRRCGRGHDCPGPVGVWASIAASSGAAKAFARRFARFWWTRPAKELSCPYYDPRLERDPGWLPLDAIAAADAALVDVRWPDGAAVVLRTARDAGAPAVLDADVGPREVILGLAETREPRGVFRAGGDDRQRRKRTRQEP